MTDGASTKVLIDFCSGTAGGSAAGTVIAYDFVVFVEAGISVTAQSSGSNFLLVGCTRQIADISGNLINP